MYQKLDVTNIEDWIEAEKVSHNIQVVGAIYFLIMQV